MADTLVVRGAREHNLRNVSLELPRDKLIVFTGLSGSGKSSLAFDTIYAEGQRRYVESLSAYARQFLGQMDKPDVDFIEGLSPAISIDQKSASRNPRSTVGTITEVYDYLRLLYARIGVPALPERRHGGHPPDARSRSSTASSSCPRAPASRCWRRWCGAARASTRRCSPTWPRRASPGPGSTARSTSSTERASSWPATSSTPSRSSSTGWCGATGIERRLTDSLETALRLAEGVAEVEIVPREGRATRPRRRDASPSASTWPARRAARRFDELAPRNFSFNSPYGACEHCDGLGTRFEVDPELVVPEPRPHRSTRAPSRRGPAAAAQYFHRVLEAVADELRHPRSTTPWTKLHEGRAEGAALRLGHQAGARQYKNRYGRTRSYYTHYEGVDPVPAAPPLRGRERLRSASRSRATCARCPAPSAAAPACKPRVAGRHRRRPQHLRAVRPVDRRGGRVRSPALELSERDRMIAERVVKEINARMGFLLDVGLDYLTLSPLGRHAGRRRGAAHPAAPARSAAAWSACSTCSTSRRSACTSATTAA